MVFIASSIFFVSYLAVHACHLKPPNLLFILPLTLFLDAVCVSKYAVSIALTILEVSNISVSICISILSFARCLPVFIVSDITISRRHLAGAHSMGFIVLE